MDVHRSPDAAGSDAVSRQFGEEIMTAPNRLKQAIDTRHKSLSITVYEQLRDKIVWGAIPPGSVLSLRQLADELSVGLMPVRDALHRLASDELVELRPRTATRVVPISIERITEMFEVRTRLETLAGRLATLHLSVSDLNRLRRCQDNMERAGTRGHAAGWHKWNQEFHSLIFRKCGNSLLQRMTQNLWDRNVRLFTPRVVTQAAFRNRRSAEHRQIIAAFERRDPDAVEAAYHRHMMHSGSETIAFLRSLTPRTSNSQIPAHSGRKRLPCASIDRA
jgi:DNA-binding GntR family transcriptional regulator